MVYTEQKKTTGSDNIPHKLWMFEGEDLFNEMVRIIGQVWRGQGILQYTFR